MTNPLITTGRLERVLVATDGSEYAAGAIRVGIGLARRMQARLIGLSVAVFSLDQSTQVPRVAEEARMLAEERLAASIAGVQGVELDRLVYDAEEPATGIVDAAAEVEADLIVMGRRGKRGLARDLVGDATVRVIGRGHAPVLVVPREAALWERRILLATDGSDYSRAAAQAAGHVAKSFGLPVTVVSAVVASHSSERRRLAEEAVSAEVERLRGEGIGADGRVVEGRVDEAILGVAEREGADLVVMGTHGRTGLKKILLGSVAERVIGQTDCPVLVVKP